MPGPIDITGLIPEVDFIHRAARGRLDVGRHAACQLVRTCLRGWRRCPCSTRCPTLASWRVSADDKPFTESQVEFAPFGARGNRGHRRRA